MDPARTTFNIISTVTATVTDTVTAAATTVATSSPVPTSVVSSSDWLSLKDVFLTTFFTVYYMVVFMFSFAFVGGLAWLAVVGVIYFVAWMVEQAPAAWKSCKDNSEAAREYFKRKWATRGGSSVRVSSFAEVEEEVLREKFAMSVGRAT